MESYVIGYYNEYRYSVRLFTDKNPNGDDIYDAGNSPYDSQVSIAHGVGLARMKEYCELTTKMLAIEHKARYAGIEKLFTVSLKCATEDSSLLTSEHSMLKSAIA